MNVSILAGNSSENISHHVSWSAILAGVVISLFIASLFNLLGLGLGLTTFIINPEQLANIGIGAVIWLIIAGVVSMMIGGWTTGILANLYTKIAAIIHGIIVASLSLILTFLFMASAAGVMVTGLAGAINQTLSTAEQNMPSEHKTPPHPVAHLLQQSTNTNTEKANPDENIGNQQQTNNEQAKQVAAETTEKATTAIGSVSMLGFIVFLLSSIAGILGALLGSAPKRNQVV